MSYLGDRPAPPPPSLLLFSSSIVTMASIYHPLLLHPVSSTLLFPSSLISPPSFRRDVVKTVPLFAMCNEDVQQEICYHLRLSFVSPGSVIMKEDEVPTHLYVVRIGRVELSKKSSTLMIAEKGAIFGENAIFGLSPTGRRTRTACALTMCELCMLSVEDVQFLLGEKKSFSYTLQNLLTSHFSSLQVFFWHSHLILLLILLVHLLLSRLLSLPPRLPMMILATSHPSSSSTS